LGHLRQELSQQIIAKQRVVFESFVPSQNPSIHNDPVGFAAQYTSKNDIEVSAWVASVFAFGQVSVFLPLLDKMHNIWQSPHAYIKSGQFLKDPFWKSVRYRWYTGQDVITLLNAMSKILNTYGSLGNHAKLIFDQSKDFEAFVLSYAADWRTFLHGPRVSRGVGFMVPDPMRRSTMKRLLLFIRWMVHDQSPDFGLWTFVPKDQLWVALDTHMTQFAKQFGWMTGSQLNLDTVKDVSHMLSKVYPASPLALDFVLTQMGITRACKHVWHSEHCTPCKLKSICTPLEKPKKPLQKYTKKQL